MSFKDLGTKNAPPRVETPEDAELRARAAARHKAKETKREEHHRRAGNEPQGGARRDEPQK